VALYSAEVPPRTVVGLRRNKDCVFGARCCSHSVTMPRAFAAARVAKALNWDCSTAVATDSPGEGRRGEGEGGFIASAAAALNTYCYSASFQ
jgi:hypothetical protein